MFSIIIHVQNAILKSFVSFIHVGGTLDVTVHELMENGAIRELYKATGGTFGGENVNRQFRILLEQISPNPSLIIMPVTILWIGSVS